MQPHKRKRARLACQPCRERKRKCDGSDPCVTCSDWGYRCHYEVYPRKPRAAKPTSPATHVEPHSSPHDTSGPATGGSDHSGLVRRLEANSGAAFVRKLGLKIDPAKAPKLNLFGWNIGARQLSASLQPTPLRLTEITSLGHMKELAQAYFTKVDPCYGFIDRHEFFERLEARWQSHVSAAIFDSVLAGVAAIGCLFSQKNPTMTEIHLTQTAVCCLDTHRLSGPPNIDLLTGWVLRSIYLRMTDSPYATWIASSTTMHLLEASGLHPEPSPDSVLPHGAKCDPDIRRRLVGVAHHLNVWTSFDLGLSRVSFQRNDLPTPPAPKAGDYTGEVLGLLPMSVSLDPGKSKDETDLTSALCTLLDGSHTQPPSVLAQCNLVLCVLRRIHTQNLDISSPVAGRVLQLLSNGLACARRMALDYSPWHQVANVPFQIICVLLTMDTRPSLAMLPEAMQTLSLVASTYDTETMREAYSAAYLLVFLHQKRRKDDLAIFGAALNCQNEKQFESPPHLDPASEEYSWLGALVADMPGLQRIDLDQFLNSEMMDPSTLLNGTTLLNGFD
ncbi:hypothetical protein N7468_001119 [Penicillium chermesinum]|uniref:Zn(2)-C6 fungal-type domain-containing protein n=1 Tax=Penicillium chermesinum TaxID=63820 RepID=A0A9W9PG11_9EURO|nr:uncharacterized protein N7468_001119 [Penicillium chermesinum]KAJ5246136.1 hypothetical protein N7468_001119 [Penicillium chermesinum]KAJ6144423.1 hypothetical protein N7470_008318 [Penicillium chermesinum]